MEPIKIILRDGLVSVEGKLPGIEEKLRYFRREIKQVKWKREVIGRWENLYTRSPDNPDLIYTMPGFAHRILDYCRSLNVPYGFEDVRTPMPKPDYARAFKGLRPYQVELVGKMLASGGGILQAATGCLGEGTPVRFADGTTKPVEQLKSGDKLLAFDDVSWRLTSTTVCDIIRTSPNHKPKPMIEVQLDDEKITVTYDHPFFAGDGFYPIYQLVWGEMEKSQRSQLKLLCEQYGTPFDDSTVWCKQSGSNEPVLRPEWILQDDARWAYREGAQDRCGELAGESAWTSDSEPYRLQSFKQQSGQPGVVLGEVQCVVWGNPWQHKTVSASETGHPHPSGAGRDTPTVPGKDRREEIAEEQSRSCKERSTAADPCRVRTCAAREPGIVGKVRLRPLVTVKAADTYYTVRTREAPYTYCIGSRHCYLTHNCGKTICSAAIIRAYDRDELISRGTPTCVFACPDKDVNRKNWEEFRRLFPDRDVGIYMSGAHKPSDDIVCVTLDSLDNIDPRTTGLLIVDEMHASASDTRAQKIAEFSKARRWGVSATPLGRFDGKDLVSEGLYGPVVATFSYQDGVRSGALVPITVYWVESPAPVAGLEAYSRLKMKDAKVRWASSGNEDFCQLVADILNCTPDSLQTLCMVQFIETMGAIHSRCKKTGFVHGETDPDKIVGLPTLSAVKPKERKEIYERFRNEEISSMISTFCWKQGCDFPNLSVVVNASNCGSDIVAKQIPGRASRNADGKEMAYIVDFVHTWDRADPVTGKGRPGPLLSNDMSRRKAYKELGFTQCQAQSITQLPFLDQALVRESPSFLAETIRSRNQIL